MRSAAGYTPRFRAVQQYRHHVSIKHTNLCLLINSACSPDGMQSIKCLARFIYPCIYVVVSAAILRHHAAKVAEFIDVVDF